MVASLAQVTADYRRLNLALRAGTMRDLLKLWPALDWARIDETYPGWAAAVYALVQRDRGTASGLATAYLKATRSLAKVKQPQAAVLAPALDVEQFGASMQATTVAAIKKSALAGLSQQVAMENAFVQSSGAATRHVLNGGRDTIRLTTEADPHARGWTRVTSGRSCQFCDGLADGSVLPGSVDMATHDHCSCSPQPVYR